jgi:tetratricopeptide (TPR) repeat protein
MEKEVTGEIILPIPPMPYFAHPYPLQENFTGRLSERKELTEWFIKGSCPMFAYVAIGGMGKSALTWYWLQEDIIKQGLAPEGIIWWSFYDREARFETFLEKAIKYVSKGEKDPKQIPGVRDKMETLYTFLCNNRFLIVLDGVERVLRTYAGLGSPYQGDEVTEDKKQEFRACIDPNIGTFLQWLASSNIKTKTLLTSRLPIKELDDIAGCLHKELKKLNKEDAVDFFHLQGVKGNRDEIERACEPFGYHPLSLRLLSGMIVKDPKYMGDIKAWTKYNPLLELKGKEHYILELAYNSLDEKKQTLISKLSAFRNPMDYNSILIFNEFEVEREFDEALVELVDRGLLLKDVEKNKYDLHPIVRRYCYYERLLDKTAVHSQLRDYFAAVPEPEKIESLDDLAPVIELYHHTVNSGGYNEAMELYRDRLSHPLYFQFGAYNLQIDLLRALFPDGEDKLPRLKSEVAQAWTLNGLANSYFLSGQSKKAVSLFERNNELQEKAGDKENLAIGLGNLARSQMMIGDFKSAESNLRRRISLCQEIKDEFREAVGHQELGRLLAYQGKFEESEKELAKSLKYDEEHNDKQGQCVGWAYRALRALLMSDAEEALRSAKRARELADVEKMEIDIIRAEWLLGASYLAKGGLKEAEEHLSEALVRDRRINLVELEPDILLELAKLRFKKGDKEEALKLAEEALGIANRSEYRLKQADIHNFLAEFYYKTGDFSKAKEQVEKAKERAECGYQPAMKKAEELSKKISQQIKQM